MGDEGADSAQRSWIIAALLLLHLKLTIKTVITTFLKDDCMAPRKRFVTPIMTAFDKRYFCTRCENDHLGRQSDLNDRHWTCNTCGEPVYIELTDNAGNGFTVERRPAKTLTTNDYVVFEHDLSQLARVYDSKPAMGKGNLWYLALEGFGFDRVDPDRYYNCIPG